MGEKLLTNETIVDLLPPCTLPTQRAICLEDSGGMAQPSFEEDCLRNLDHRERVREESSIQWRSPPALYLTLDWYHKIFILSRQDEM